MMSKPSSSSKTKWEVVDVPVVSLTETKMVEMSTQTQEPPLPFVSSDVDYSAIQRLKKARSSTMIVSNNVSCPLRSTFFGGLSSLQPSESDDMPSTSTTELFHWDAGSFYAPNEDLLTWQNIAANNIFSPTNYENLDIDRKKKYQIGVNLFNIYPFWGITYLVNHRCLSKYPWEVAKFLLKETNLCRQMIGEYLGNLYSPFSAAVLHYFLLQLNFNGMSIDQALREFIKHFLPPKKSYEITKVLEKFSERYSSCNPQVVCYLNSRSTVYRLAYAILLLNTDLHSPSLKNHKRMTIDEFMRNLEGIDNGKNVPRHMLACFYQRIKMDQLLTAADHTTELARVGLMIKGINGSLVATHRRAVGYYKFCKIQGFYANDDPLNDVRRVLLFNDLLVIAKIVIAKDDNTELYVLDQLIPLRAIQVEIFCTKDNLYSVCLSVAFRGTHICTLNVGCKIYAEEFVRQLRDCIEETEIMQMIVDNMAIRLNKKTPTLVEISDGSQPVLTADEVPLPMSEDEVPFSINEDEVPLPMREDEVPLSINKDEVPLPMSEDEVPLPMSEDEVPLPMSEDEVPLPMSEDEVPLPMSEDEVPLPMSEVEVPLSINVDEIPLPINVDEVPLPMSGNEVPMPINEDEVPLPMSEVEVPLSINVDEVPLPMNKDTALGSSSRVQEQDNALLSSDTDSDISHTSSTQVVKALVHEAKSTPTTSALTVCASDLGLITPINTTTEAAIKRTSTLKSFNDQPRVPLRTTLPLSFSPISLVHSADDILFRSMSLVISEHAEHRKATGCTLSASEDDRKKLFQIGVSLFNVNPFWGIRFLANDQLLDETPRAVANFLLEQKCLSKQRIGEYLADLYQPFNTQVLQYFLLEIDFTGLSIDQALRKFQTYFLMPKRSHEIFRLLQVFSKRYSSCNEQEAASFRNPRTIFLLAYAILMLNTDLHIKTLKPEQHKRMTVEEFVDNLKGIDDGWHIPRAGLEGIYKRIKEDEFKTGNDNVSRVLEVQQSIKGLKLNLAVPHRYLVSHCQFYEIKNIWKKQKYGDHPRYIYLFNDVLVVTKYDSTEKGGSRTFRGIYSLCGMEVQDFRSKHFPFGLTIIPSVVGKTRQFSINARNNYDYKQFGRDLKERIEETNELQNMQCYLDRVNITLPVPDSSSHTSTSEV